MIYLIAIEAIQLYFLLYKQNVQYRLPIEYLAYSSPPICHFCSYLAGTTIV
uniref:Uncharacterized protein n=1 Tax=Arundo donax TaxID=35708 RepID=A0A0A9GFW2_ARUDO